MTDLLHKPERSGSGMAQAGNLAAASIAEEARNRPFMPHADSGWHTLKRTGRIWMPAPRGWRPCVLQARTAAMETAFAQTTLFSNRLSRCQPPELNAVRADLGQVVLRLLRKPAFGAASENLR